MTPRKAAKIRKDAWSLALSEGRVIKLNGGETLKSYATVEQANVALDKYIASGIVAEIVRVIPTPDLRVTNFVFGDDPYKVKI